MFYVLLLKIALSAARLMRCDLTPLDYYLWGAVKDTCNPNKPETTDALKDNIRKAIGDMQLHTIDNVLKIIGPIV